MKKILQGKSGVSLTELVVAMCIFAIISIAVSAFLVPSLNLYTRASELSELNVLVNSLGNEITGDMSQASSVSVSSGQITMTLDGANVVYSVDASGFLVRNGTQVMAPRYYRNKTIAMTCVDAEVSTPTVPVDPTTNTKSFLVNLRLTGAKGEIINRSFAVKPIMLSQ